MDDFLFSAIFFPFLAPIFTFATIIASVIFGFVVNQYLSKLKTIVLGLFVGILLALYYLSGPFASFRKPGLFYTEDKALILSAIFFLFYMFLFLYIGIILRSRVKGVGKL